MAFLVDPQVKIAYIAPQQGRQPAAYRQSNLCPEPQSARCTPNSRSQTSSTRPSNWRCHGHHETSSRNQGYPCQAQQGSSLLHPPIHPKGQKRPSVSAHISLTWFMFGTEACMCCKGWKSPATSKQPQALVARTWRARMKSLPPSAGNHQSLFISQIRYPSLFHSLCCSYRLRSRLPS